MPIEFNDLDVVSKVTGLSSALIVPCNMCPAVSVAVRENKPFIQFFKSFLKSAPEREQAFHSILQELPEVGTFRTIHQGSTIPAERGRCKNNGVQKQSLSPMVSLHVDLAPTQEAAEMC
jgi:hypothetical protein